MQLLVALLQPIQLYDIGAPVHVAVSVMLVPAVGVWLLADSEHAVFAVGAAACCHTTETTTGALVLDGLLAVRT